jgi:hypothetical protein
MALRLRPGAAFELGLDEAMPLAADAARVDALPYVARLEIESLPYAKMMLGISE